MDVLPTQGSEQRDARGRWLPGVAPIGARPWKKGQAPNPTGKSGDYHEALKLARETSMRSITRLIELRESADEQIATVASKSLWEISWGRPKDFDPKAEVVRSSPSISACLSHFSPASATVMLVEGGVWVPCLTSYRAWALQSAASRRGLECLDVPLFALVGVV